MNNTRHTIRLRSHDYSQPGYYFLTICSIDRECIFDNRLKDILSDNWLKLPNRFTNVITDIFIVMPNHFHGILQLTNNYGRENRAPTQSPLPTLGKIVAYFKYTSTKIINDKYGDGQKLPIFQRNYYERIIRNNSELDAVRNYIRSNPQNWDVEKEKIFVPYVGARFSRPINI